MPQNFIYLFTLCLITVFANGCAVFGTRVAREGILSQELPLTVDDLHEIQMGEKNHEKILSQYTLYESPKLQIYLDTIAANIAEVSVRPHLPYKVFILDDEEVNIFGGPGGHIYVTRGLLNFVESESEIAALIAHEIGHISHNDYGTIPHQSKVGKVYQLLLQGTEIGKEAIGTYATAANYGLKAVKKAAPHIAYRFGQDAEIVADELAVSYLVKAGYDPRGLRNVVNRLSTIEMGEVRRFVVFLNAHPPFVGRRRLLEERVARIDFSNGAIEFRQDTLNEVRQMTVNAPDSLLFTPAVGVHHLSPVELERYRRNQEEKDPSFRKRNAVYQWF